MPDVFTKQKRSEVMSRIRSRGNKGTELAAIEFFRRNGIKGWRRHVRIKFRVPSSMFRVAEIKNSKLKMQNGGEERRARRSRPTSVRPDFVFRKERLAVFIDGCFWHGCPTHGTRPSNNRAFWRKKLAGNIARDRLVDRALRASGWRVLRVWEHELAQELKRQNGKGKMRGKLHELAHLFHRGDAETRRRGRHKRNKRETTDEHGLNL